MRPVFRFTSIRHPPRHPPRHPLGIRSVYVRYPFGIRSAFARCLLDNGHPLGRWGGDSTYNSNLLILLLAHRAKVDVFLLPSTAPLPPPPPSLLVLAEFGLLPAEHNHNDEKEKYKTEKQAAIDHFPHRRCDSLPVRTVQFDFGSNPPPPLVQSSSRVPPNPVLIGVKGGDF